MNLLMQAHIWPSCSCGAAEAPLAVQPVTESMKALSVLPKARENAQFTGPDEASPRMINYKAVSKDTTSC